MPFADEIKEMLGSGQDSSTEAPGTEPPGTEAPGTEAPTTEAPAEFETEAPSTEAPGTESPSTEAPTTEAPEEDEKDARIAALEAQLKEMATRAKPATAAPGSEAPTTEAPLEMIDFVGDQEVDTIVGSKEALNEFLNNALRSMFDTFSPGVSENVLRNIPNIVKSQVMTTVTLQKTVDDFYRENPDLANVREFVGIVGAEIASKNPDKPPRWIFEEAGKEARKRLKLKAAADKKTPAQKTTQPGGTKSGRGAKPAPKTGMAKEIDDMLKSS